MGSAFELLALCCSGAAQWERVGTGFVGLALGLSSVLSVSLPYSFLTLLLVPNINGCPLNCGFCIYLSSSTQSFTFFHFFYFGLSALTYCQRATTLFEWQRFLVTPSTAPLWLRLNGSVGSKMRAVSSWQNVFISLGGNQRTSHWCHEVEALVAVSFSAAC